jgi:two-component system nitrogen regulation response regulator GlnG
MRWALRTILSEVGLSVMEADSGPSGLEVAARSPLAAVLLDMRMAGPSGEEVLTRLKQQSEGLPIIVITGYGTIAGAVDAIRAGAFDYLTKPFDNDAVVSVVKSAIAQRPGPSEPPASGLREAVVGLMGHSAAIQDLITQMEVVIGTDYSVLISGETGTGKEIVAQALHRHGPRTARPFVVFDCGSIAEALVDSEFFGHERGAYTGATERRRGRFEMAAEGGTIFLDEIGNLCAVGQQALLRALEERVIYRLGGSTPIRLDTRVIAATNETLADDDAGATFRPDLYYRLSEYTISVPPLRTRPGDIEFLTRRFLAQTQRGMANWLPDITPDALDMLRGYSWPGNVRQLRNVVRRAALIAMGRITAGHIGQCLQRPPARDTVPNAAPLSAAPPCAADRPLRERVESHVKLVERESILRAMTQTGGNKAAAARTLGVDYKSFRTKLKTIQQQALAGHDFTSA